MVVRTSGDPRSLVGHVRTELKAIDSGVPLTKIRTMEDVVDDTVAGRRFNMLLVSLFATLALVLTTIGLYGSVSFWVSQRTREIGIQMALGANRGDVILQVIRQGLKLVLLGVVIGLVGAFTLTRFLAHLLFGITPGDPGTFVGVVSLLLAVALLACYIPAYRAAKIDPMEALRYE